MKLNKPSFSNLLALTLVLCPFSTLTADTFLLNDGTKIEGTIISETKRSYLVRAEISRNVYGEKTVLKLDVTKHIEEDKSIKAFEKISKLLPTADILTAKSYADIIDNKVKPFITKFPKSPKIEEAIEILQTLESEQAIILKGGIKLDGILLTVDELNADKYEISASLDLKKFIKSVQRKQYRPALSKLSEMETLYPNSTQVRKAQKVALEILPIYEDELKVLLSEVDRLIERKERTLSSLEASERNRTLNIFKSQEKKYETLLASNKAEKSIWLPINPYYKSPIKANLQMIPKEQTRLAKESKLPSIMAGTLYRSTLQALEDGDLPKALELHKQFNDVKPSEMFADNLATILQEKQTILEEMAAKKAEEERMAEEKRLEEERIAAAEAAAAKKVADEKRDKDVDGFLDLQKKKQQQIEELRQNQDFRPN